MSAGLEDHLVALVGLMRVAEAGELPDRPLLAAITGRIEPTCERVLAGPSDSVESVGRAGRRAIDRLDLDTGQRREVGVAPRGSVEAFLPALAARLDLVRVHVSDGTALPQLFGLRSRDYNVFFTDRVSSSAAA
jgi:hypothetical protein